MCSSLKEDVVTVGSTQHSALLSAVVKICARARGVDVNPPNVQRCNNLTLTNNCTTQQQSITRQQTTQVVVLRVRSSVKTSLRWFMLNWIHEPPETASLCEIVDKCNESG